MDQVLPETLDAAGVAALRAAIEVPGPLVLRGGCRGMALDSAPDGLVAFAEVLLTLRGRPWPTVAVVTGDAMGGGLGLVAACEVVLADPGARFALPELLFGLLPAMIAPILEERVAPAALRRLALTGEAIAASTALSLGLVDQLTTDPSPFLRSFSRAEPEARRAWKAVPPALAARVRAGAQDTAARVVSPACSTRRARFADGLTPWGEP